MLFTIFLISLFIFISIGISIYFLNKKKINPYIKVSSIRKKNIKRNLKKPFLFWDNNYGQEWSGRLESIRNGSGLYARGHEFHSGKRL